MYRNEEPVRLLYSTADGGDHLRLFTSLSEARESVPAEAVDWAICQVVRRYGTGWVEFLDCKYPE